MVSDSAMPNSPVRTFRQQAWINAHERQSQHEAEDLFGWWCSMRLQGRISSACEGSLSACLRQFNVTQLAPLPMTFE
ncbi:hypothetical protein AWB80_02858 [Caballeronia pedi]|uniref:Uncharacterized protein n=1 Tax=Caballeronia pedi TaxID=1777141 RepID=A0A158B079_9BURK|nr:hypothetical protein [Caballeronia pedi]SAK63379.1 hypothetical protein AWB80_02858 [Caballeronia pedi]